MEQLSRAGGREYLQSLSARHHLVLPLPVEQPAGPCRQKRNFAPVEPDRPVECGECRQLQVPLEDWRCSKCGVPCYFDSRHKTCSSCGRSPLMTRAGYEVTSNCVCVATPEQLAARARGEADRAWLEARERDNRGKAAAVKARQAAEAEAAKLAAVEHRELVKIAADCLNARGGECDVTLAKIEHRGCPKCEHLVGPKRPRRRRERKAKT